MGNGAVSGGMRELGAGTPIPAFPRTRGKGQGRVFPREREKGQGRVFPRTRGKG